MKLAWILLGLLLAMWIVVGVAIWMGESEVGHGFKHPQVAAMDRGGSGLQRHEHVLVWGWLCGLLEISVFVACLMLGSRRGRRLGPIVWPLVIGGAIFGGMFTLLIAAYRNYLYASDPVFLGPFPLPTALMIFGMWGVPLLFVILYVVAFDRWIFTLDDALKFQELVAARKASKEADE